MAALDEEDIDLETLQAQIDRSIAFADELASSWLKPSTKSSTHRTTEREFQELIRRPPRLGVGAAVPEATSSNSRDTARLKGRLTGAKKRGREEEPSRTPTLPTSQDEEDESRAGAIRKKQKVDPFTIPTKKAKADKNKTGELKGVEAPFVGSRGKSSANGATDGASSRQPRGAPALPVASSSKTTCAVPAVPPNEQTLTADTTSNGIAKPHAHAGDTSAAERVLFLDGPPSESDGDGPEVSASAKKKRKRRKKKKKGKQGEQGTGSGREDGEDDKEHQ